MDVVLGAGTALLEGSLGFLAWLGIHPSLQDLVKAIILTVFVLGILMIVGDVYRGEIQNTMHRIILAPSSKGAALPEDQRSALAARRRQRKEKDIICHVPQTLVPLTLNDIYSNVLIHLRYRDCAGRIQTKRIENYRIRFHVRKLAHPGSLRAGHENDHQYTPDEEDLFSDESNVTVITMAESRVDYIQKGKVEPLLEEELTKYERLKGSGIRQALAGIKNGNVRPPEALGLAVKFHFPIDPPFLLYKHPDTNVRTTAWLTVLTSVFALFMQLIYAGGTQAASAEPERPAIVRSVGAGQ